MTIRPRPKPAQLETVDAVIEAVGGNLAAADLTGRSPQQVSNWRAAGKISPFTFLVFAAALRRRRLRANPMLWRIEQPEKPA